MREDFDKILTERPRLGGYGVRKRRVLRDGQPYPSFLGTRRGVKERGDFKDLNENLQPLRRYLERQIGRPWNNVHGEMRERIRAGNTVQEHVLTHIPQFLYRYVGKVAPSAQAPCGLVVMPPDRAWFGPNAADEGRLYVDPDDGLIKRARRKLKGPRTAR